MRAGAPWLLVAVLWAVPAVAGDRWSDPYPGIRHLHRTTGRPWDLHVVTVDLGRPELRVIATRPGDRRTVTSEFARRHGAQVAINANFYGGSSCGLAMGDGQKWNDSYEDGCRESVGFGREENRARCFSSTAVGDPPEGWITDVVSGKPRVVRDGQVVRDYDCGFHICARHPRTVVGLSEDRRTLILLVVDGRSGRSVGMNGEELGGVVRELGAHEAVNLDGGGSTTLWIEAEGGVVNRPSDGRERTVMNHLGVQVDGDRRWWAAEHVEQSGYPTLEAGGEAELWVRYRNRGRARWRPDGDHPVRLGTDGPEDRESAFFHPDDWVSPTRATAVDGVTQPGDVGRFTFRIRAPDAAGSYREAFTPVAEGGGWMRPVGMFWDVTVAEPPAPDGDAASGLPDVAPPSEPETENVPRPEPGTCWPHEVCNGVDDDCDGETDEGDLDGGVATLLWTADDRAEVWANGVLVGSDDGWGVAAEVGFHLAAGENVLAVLAHNTGGPGGVLAETELPSGDVVGSDARWRVLPGEPPDGWRLPGFDDGGWAAATAAGAYGVGSWGERVEGFEAGSPARWIWAEDPEAPLAALRWSVWQPAACRSGDGEVGALRCAEGRVRCVAAGGDAGGRRDGGGAPDGGGAAVPDADTPGGGSSRPQIGCHCRQAAGRSWGGAVLSGLLRRQ